MVIAKLNAAVSYLQGENTYFFGNMSSRVEINETITSDKDEREGIIPFGVSVSVFVEDRREIEINATPHYFNIEDDGWYYLFLSHDGLMFRLNVMVKDGKIDMETTNLEVYDYCEFIGGSDDYLQKIYAKDFKKIETYNS